MFLLKGTRFVLIAIFLVQSFDNCASLEKHGKGVCDEAMHSMRLQGKTTTALRYVCCDNHEYDVDLDQCLPICSFGCVNGTCTDVDTCTCTAPLTLVGHTCVLSTCSNCEHGNCVAPNDCRCHEGYIKLNGTCTPICTTVCVNGQCVEPNKCKCNDGYRTDPNDAFNCIEQKISACVAPEKCGSPLICPLADEDYTPTCSLPCTNGNCPTPDQCFCNKGFNLMCSVICNHGYCSRPSNCKCKPKKKGAFRFTLFSGFFGNSNFEMDAHNFEKWITTVFKKDSI